MNYFYEPLQLHWPVSISHVLPMEPTAWQLQAEKIEDWKLLSFVFDQKESEIENNILIFFGCCVFCCIKWNFLTYIRRLRLSEWEESLMLSKHKLHKNSKDEMKFVCRSIQMKWTKCPVCFYYIWCCQEE